MYNPLILSEEHVIEFAQNHLNGHVLVAGPSGGGKTVSFVEPNLLHAKDNMIVRLSKRSLVEKYKPYYAKNGYRVFDMNLSRPEHTNKQSVCYDIMSSVIDESTVHRLAEQIILLDDTRSSVADPYWASASTNLLKAIMFLVLAEKNNANFADVLDCFAELDINEGFSDGSIVTSLDDRFELLEKAAPSHEAIRAWRSFSNLPSRTAGCVYGSLAAVMQLFTRQLKDAMRNLPAFSVEEFCKQKSILFVTVNATDMSRFKISNLLFEDIIHGLLNEADLNGGTLPRRTRLIIDDFGVGGVIEAVPAAISFVREAGISMSLMCQSLTQLNTMYGAAKAATVRNNCDSTVYIGAPNDLETANEMALRLNCPVADLLTLLPDQELVCRRGSPARLTRRYRTLEDPLYKEVTSEYALKAAMGEYTLPARPTRKDFSARRGKIEAIQDLSNEISVLTERLDQRYKQLTGGEIGHSKKKAAKTG